MDSCLTCSISFLRRAGAGKTTTIGMLTGAIQPTEGYATVSGKDIRTQLQQIRQDIGICLQHDCLFPALTVREHIQFFSRIKGVYATMSHEEAEAQVDAAIHDVALAEKTKTMSKNLSGGMKRKLSVAIAFCGGSKVVLLDEPTSGTLHDACLVCMIVMFVTSPLTIHLVMCQVWIPSADASLGT
jgi:ABC-type multidrug transport system ATPase subunit